MYKVEHTRNVFIWIAVIAGILGFLYLGSLRLLVLFIGEFWYLVSALGLNGAFNSVVDSIIREQGIGNFALGTLLLNLSITCTVAAVALHAVEKEIHPK